MPLVPMWVQILGLYMNMVALAASEVHPAGNLPKSVRDSVLVVPRGSNS